MLASYYLLKLAKVKQDENVNYYSNLLGKNLSTSRLTTKCRVCLQEGHYSIYEYENPEAAIEALQIFGNIYVSEDDGLTKLLCSTCYKFLTRAISFRKVAQRSEELLKKPVKKEGNNHDNSDSSEAKEPENWLNNQDFIEIKPEKKVKVQQNIKVTCPVCNKVMNRSSYKEHATLHDPNPKKYVCDVCGKSFRMRCAYHNHRARHSTGFPFKCQFCPYKAQYGELLKVHMRRHTGDYRYMCTECPARFLVKSNLNRHMFRHNEPQFKCDNCKKAFHTKPMLERHFQCDHMGLKNHVCNICGKAFGYRKAMMNHQLRVHKREKISSGRMPNYLQAENKVSE